MLTLFEVFDSLTNLNNLTNDVGSRSGRIMNLSNQVVTRDVVAEGKCESQSEMMTATKRCDSRRIDTSNVNFDNDLSMLRIPPFDVLNLELLSVLLWPNCSFKLLRVFKA